MTDTDTTTAVPVVAAEGFAALTPGFGTQSFRERLFRTPDGALRHARRQPGDTTTPQVAYVRESRHAGPRPGTAHSRWATAEHSTYEVVPAPAGSQPSASATLDREVLIGLIEAVEKRHSYAVDWCDSRPGVDCSEWCDACRVLAGVPADVLRDVREP